LYIFLLKHYEILQQHYLTNIDPISNIVLLQTYYVIVLDKLHHWTVKCVICIWTFYFHAINNLMIVSCLLTKHHSSEHYQLEPHKYYVCTLNRSSESLLHTSSNTGLFSSALWVSKNTVLEHHSSEHYQLVPHKYYVCTLNRSLESLLHTSSNTGLFSSALWASKNTVLEPRVYELPPFVNIAISALSVYYPRQAAVDVFWFSIFVFCLEDCHSLTTKMC